MPFIPLRLREAYTFNCCVNGHLEMREIGMIWVYLT